MYFYLKVDGGCLIGDRLRSTHSRPNLNSSHDTKMLIAYNHVYLQVSSEFWTQSICTCISDIPTSLQRYVGTRAPRKDMLASIKR